MRGLAALLTVSFVAVAACSSSSSPSDAQPSSSSSSSSSGGDIDTTDAGATEDADASASPDAPLTGMCATSFGNTLTPGFGRIDGYVYAVQKPTDTQCTMPNSDHLVVQVLMNGAVYRMVANVSGVGYFTESHALPAPAFAEGWHTGVALDYVTTLDAHSTSFTPYAMNDVVAKVASELVIGARVSVYATCGAGRPESAHLVHRNATNADGAIVIGPETPTPKFLLFDFSDQTF